MLTAYTRDCRKLEMQANAMELPAGALWIDMLKPTPEEEALVKKTFGVDVPTLDEMRQIETSSMLYREDGAVFMTAILLSDSETGRPKAFPVTFILVRDILLSVRHSQPKSFHIFSEKFRAETMGRHAAEKILTGILETAVGRASDVLEKIYTDVDGISHMIFHHREEGKTRDFEAVLRSIGEKGDLNSKLRESLVSLGRVVNYYELSLSLSKALDRGMKADISTIRQDISALMDHAAFLSHKINFLLDASLGMINIQQNAIIKFFSVAAVVFLPPTLVASIYGMNFVRMPELEWALGYPAALLLMVLSAAIPYMYFKKRGWL